MDHQSPQVQHPVASNNSRSRRIQFSYKSFCDDFVSREQGVVNLKEKVFVPFGTAMNKKPIRNLLK